MIKMIKAAAILLALFGFMQLTGCAPTYQRQALSLENRSQIASTHVLVNGVQHHVMIHQNSYANPYMSSNYEPMPEGAVVTPTQPVNNSGGGIAGLIANAIIQHVADRHDQNQVNKELPLILLAQGHDHFMFHFKQNLMKQLRHLRWLNASSGQLGFHLRDDKNALMAQTADNTELFVGTTYALNSNLNQLEVTANVEADVNQGNHATPIYKNIFTYIYKLNHSANRDLNQTAWANYGAKLLKTQLHDAAITLSHLIVKDIAQPMPRSALNSLMTVTLRPIHGMTEGKLVQAHVIHHDKNRFTVLMPNGEIYNVNQRYLVNQVG